jgi:starch synthase
MAGALRRAIKMFKHQDAWKTIQRAGMGGDFSWQVSARQYAELYQTLMTGAGDDF